MIELFYVALFKNSSLCYVVAGPFVEEDQAITYKNTIAPVIISSSCSYEIGKSQQEFEICR